MNMIQLPSTALGDAYCTYQACFHLVFSSVPECIGLPSLCFNGLTFRAIVRIAQYNDFIF